MEENNKVEMANIERYGGAVQSIKSAIMQGQYEAAKSVNRIQLAVYFSIGKFISAHTRKNAWGSHALEFISERLRKELPGLRGFGERNLKNMRAFYEAWQMLDANSAIAIAELQSSDNENVDNSTIAIVELPATNSAIATAELDNSDEVIDIHNSMSVRNAVDFPVEDFFRIPFTHHLRIIEKVDDLQARYYYMHRTVEENLSIDRLKKIIREGAHLHQGVMPNNFADTIPNKGNSRKALMMFKDEYLLDFINVEQIGERDNNDVDERVIENEIVANIKKFIMTFGDDFTFVGNQKLLEVYHVEQFPDLLFYNRELNALVVVELKMGKFKTAYLGQLFGYLQILDDKMRKPRENPPIGIVLCQEADHAYAQYAVRDYTRPMGVSTYRTLDDMPEPLRNALPDAEKMMEIINKSR